MRFTFNWLKSFLSTDLSINQIADKLTSIGLEVDSLKDPELVFQNFQIVQIVNSEPHPNADKLKVCIVCNDSGEEKQIVCGASNARTGLKTILAIPGATIPSYGTVIKKTKLRNVESDGMLCSKSELGIQSDEDGIVELADSTDLSASIGDVLGYDGGILDVSITPNRGDCFSIKGIARDLAVAGAGKFLLPHDVIYKNSFDFPIKVGYEQSDACKTYAPVIAFRVIRGIKNGESPDWLKTKIKATGMNSISTIVDLANLWMLERGRPFHMYDLNKINGDLVIRSAKNREKFVDIKGDEHILHGDMLIAADEKDPLCLLGIIGSAKAVCDENTTDILIESALFDPISIACTGAFLNIITEARSRFERCIDKDSCVPELENVTKAIIDTCGGKASNIFVVGDHLIASQTVALSKSKLRAIIGTDIDWVQSKKILHSLGLKEVSSETEADISTFLIPSWRSDLNIEEDLIEEIIRIAGYENVREEQFDVPIKTNDPILEKMRNTFAIKRLLASRGLSEIISYSFIKLGYAEKFNCDKSLRPIFNPISDDMSTLRPSILPSLIMAAGRSLNYGKSKIALFEVGNVFFDDCVQEKHISGLRAGTASDRSWLDQTRNVDVFDVKSDAFAVFDFLGIDKNKLIIQNTAPEYYHPSRSSTVFYKKKKLAYFGELHPTINSIFSITEPMVCFEILCSDINKVKKNISQHSKVYPKINRDFSFLFDEKMLVGNMLSEIYKLDTRIMNANIFDCFKMSDEKKSVGITITIGAIDRTLTESEALEVSNKVTTYVSTIGGELRKK